MKNSNIKRKFPLTMKNSFTLVLLAFLSLAAVGQNQILSPELSLENESENLQSQLKAKLAEYENLDGSRSVWPPIWNLPTVTSMNPHGIIVIYTAHPRINDSIIKENDFIGGFFTDLNGELRCGGAGAWPGNMGNIFPLSGDDPATTDVKEGFSYGEQIHFKLFSFTTMKDYDVDIIAFGDQYYGRDKWYPLTLSRVIDMQALETFDFYISPTNNPLCIGEETTLSGEAFVAPVGSYNYLWSSSDPTLNFNYNIQNPPSVIPNATTTFFLTVDDGGTNSSQHALEIFVEEYPTVDAGQGGTICNNENFEVSGSATNYSISLWTSSGDGEFADDAELATTYMPGAGDIASGQFTLTLTVDAKNPCEGSLSDNIQVSILPAPSVVAGADQILCTNSTVIASAEANNYGSVAWTENGQGYFTDTTSLTTSYIPLFNDYSNTLIFTVTVQAASPCVISASDQMEIDFVPGPTVNGPSNITTCENTPVSLNGNGTNYSYIQWTTNGNGTFDDPMIFTAKYYVGPQDILSGNATVTLTAYSAGGCGAATKNVNINIVPLPNISFGGNSGNICEGDPFLQLNPSVQHSNNVIWSTYGDGTFSASNIINPKYYPGTNDRENEDFQLNIFAYPLQNCLLSVSEDLSVVFQSNPAVYAGMDATICEGQSYTIAGDSAQSYANLLWSGGSGTFNNPQTIHPVYTPSPGEYGSTVSLCLNASPISPCTVAANDCMQLTIQRKPTADAGANASICEGSVLEINNAQASNYTTLAWSGGSGTWQNQSTIMPTYTPASSEFGISVSLSLIANPIDPCVASVSDQKILTIKRNPTASAGNDATICQDQSYAFPLATAANHASLLWSGGNGSFSNPQSIHPSYTPAPSEYGNYVNLTLTVQANNPCTLIISDAMELFVQQNPTASVGNDATICQDQFYTLSLATADHFQSLQWSGGSGSFSNAQSLNPTYTPAPGDYGISVVLTLTAQAINPCTVAASDAMELFVQQNPESNAGPNDAICQDQSYTFFQATADHYQSLQWSGGSGIFSDAQNLIATYTPAMAEYGTTVTLTLTAQAISPCSVEASDAMELFVQQNPESNAGADAAICQDHGYTLSEATADHYQSLQWSGGSGSFSNAQSLNPTYSPAPGDYGITVVLTLTAQAINPCTVAASDAMELFVQQNPESNAGPNDAICQDQSYTFFQATADHYQSLQWSGGSGIFSDAQNLIATYTPAVAEYGTTVTLTLTAQAISPCSVEASDAMELFVQQNPESNAGSNDAICQDHSYTLSQATADHFQSLQWSGGSGSFSNAQSLNPTYTPAPGDYGITVVLTLTAQAINPCTVAASDAMELFVQQNPESNAGPNDAICQGQSFTLFQATADHYQELQWSGGSGSFSNTQNLNATYTPVVAEYGTTVTLTLTAQAISPCTIAASDEMEIDIQKLPTVNAGENLISCEGSVQLNASATDYNTVQWQNSGDGTFSNANLLNPVYTPGTQDLANQQVELTLSVNAVSPCLGSISDALEISIDFAEILEDNVEDKELDAGMLLTLQFNVSSLSNGTYNWYFNNQLISGQVNPIFTKFGVSHNDAGYYYATFTNNCGVVSSDTALVQVLETYNQALSLPIGWSGISSYILPNNPDMEQVFASVEDQMLLIKNGNQIYWPEQSINTLGDFSNLKGYAIQMTENAQLTITGKTRFPLSPVSILPGWTYLPVNTSCPVDVQSQFAAFTNITMIKDIAGSSVYWPEFGINTLITLEPGKAYYALNEGANEISTQYSWCEQKYSGDSKSAQMNFDSPWNELHKSPQSHVFGFTGESLAAFKNGDIIGAFNTSGSCVGLMMVDGSGQADYLLAYGDDPSSPQMEGATENETLSFRIFDTSQNKHFDLEVAYQDDSPQQGQFFTNGISTIEEAQIKSATALPNLAGESIELNIYPNPTTGLLTIAIKNNDSQNGEITLSNLSGQLVMRDRFENSDAIQINISDLPKGVYHLKLVSGDFVKIEKIVLR